MTMPLNKKLALVVLLSAMLGETSSAFAPRNRCEVFFGENSELIITRQSDIEKAQRYKFVESIEAGLTKTTRKLRTLARLVRDPQEGILASLKIIREAKYTLHASYYIFQSDMAGYGVLNELKEAIARGVDVYLTVDSLGTPAIARENLKALIEYANKNAGFKHDPNDYSKLLSEKASVKVAVFNPVNPIELADQAFENLVRRMHNVEVDAKTEMNALHDWITQHHGNRNKVSPELERLTADLQGRGLSAEDKMTIIKDWVNRRSHNKELAADIEHYELARYKDGGRNVGNDYFDLPAVNNGTYQDLEVIVQNDPSLPDTEKTRNHIGSVVIPFLDSLFWHSGNEMLHESLMFKFTHDYEKEIAKMEAAAKQYISSAELSAKMAAMNDPNNDYFDPKNSRATFWSLLNEMENVLRHNVAVDPSLTTNKRNLALKNSSSILSNIHARVKAAKKSIKIVSPYIDFTPEEIAFLKDAASRGIKIEIVTNSIMTSDNMPAQATVDEKVGPALLGIENITVYEFGKLDAVALGGTVPYGKLHQKTVIVDDEWLFEGTYNGDERSRNLNSETMQKFRSKQLAQDAADLFENRKQNSHVFGSPEWQKIRTNPKLGWVKIEIAKKQHDLLKVMKILGLTWLI